MRGAADTLILIPRRANTRLNSLPEQIDESEPALAVEVEAPLS